MDLQEKYDELDNIVITIGMLISETNDKYFVDMLKEIKFEAQDMKFKKCFGRKKKKNLNFKIKNLKKIDYRRK